MDATRALLDQLMGPNRNATASARASMPTKECSWKDEDVCKLALIGVCPYHAFTKTKFENGVCELKHDDAMKQQFDKEAPTVQGPIERHWLHVVDDKFLRACDRRVKQAQERVDQSHREEHTIFGQIDKKIADSTEIKEWDVKIEELAKNIAVLQEQITEMTKSAATPAADTAISATGAPSTESVSEEKSSTSTSVQINAVAANEEKKSQPEVSAAAVALQKLVEGMEKERGELGVKKSDMIKSIRDGFNTQLANLSQSTLQRGMTVCDACACLLRIDETEERKNDHLTGKLHLSFVQVRDQAKKLHDKHQQWIKDGVITEQQLREPISVILGRGGHPSSSSSSSSSSTHPSHYDRRGPPPSSHHPPQAYDVRDVRDVRSRYQQDQYQYGRPVYQPDRDRDRWDARQSQQQSSSNISRRPGSRSRSRSRDRSHRSSHHSSSSSSHHRSRRHRSRSSSRSPSTSRSGSRSRSKHSRSSRRHKHRSSRRNSRSSSSRSSKSRSKSKSKSRSRSRSGSKTRRHKSRSSSHRSDKHKRSSRSKSKEKSSKQEGTAEKFDAPTNSAASANGDAPMAV